MTPEGVLYFSPHTAKRCHVFIFIPDTRIQAKSVDHSSFPSSAAKYQRIDPALISQPEIEVDDRQL